MSKVEVNFLLRINSTAPHHKLPINRTAAVIYLKHNSSEFSVAIRVLSSGFHLHVTVQLSCYVCRDPTFCFTVVRLALELKLQGVLCQSRLRRRCADIERQKSAC